MNSLAGTNDTFAWALNIDLTVGSPSLFDAPSPEIDRIVETAAGEAQGTHAPDPSVSDTNKSAQEHTSV